MQADYRRISTLGNVFAVPEPADHEPESEYLYRLFATAIVFLIHNRGYETQVLNELVEMQDLFTRDDVSRMIMFGLTFDEATVAQIVEEILFVEPRVPALISLRILTQSDSFH